MTVGGGVGGTGGGEGIASENEKGNAPANSEAEDQHKSARKAEEHYSRPGTPGRTVPIADNSVAGKPIGSDSGDLDDPEEDEVLEESPCKRWSKRREKVKQRDVPGIDAAYLAMDNETGNEVVWNEVLFSERKNFREQEEKIRAVFDNLIRLEHPNLVKFHKYWMDTKSDKPRIIFITEYMSSGSMSRFLQRARTSGTLLNIKAWKNWTRQILAALAYLHSCDPPIVHANLTCNTVFIQQNGLVKIGCVAPKTIHHHVKTFRENIKNVHYLAPEYDHQSETSTQADIYSFGVCALEMATTGALQAGCLNGGPSGSAHPTSSMSSSLACSGGEKEKSVDVAGGMTASTSGTTMSTGGFHVITEEMVHKALNSIEDLEQKEFIERCLEHNPARRANAIELLNRLGPPEPDKNDEASLDDDGFEQPHHQSVFDSSISAGPGSLAASPPPQNVADGGCGSSAWIQTGQQQQAPASSSIQQIATKSATSGTGHLNNASSAIAHYSHQPQQQYPQQQQDGFTTTTTTTHHHLPHHHHHHFAVSSATDAALNVVGANGTMATTEPRKTTAVNLIGPTTANDALSMGALHALDEGYHTNQARSIADGIAYGGGMTMQVHSDTVGPVGSVNAAPIIPTAPQHRETRHIVHLHAELLEPDVDGRATKLRVQIQLDDQMNRQLTTQLRDEDTGESLSLELVQNGFVCESNSSRMCELLTMVLSKRQRQEQRRRRSSSVASTSTTDSSTATATTSEMHRPHQLNTGSPAKHSTG